MSSVPTVSPPPALDFEEEDDDLPRPGKVWDTSGPSLKELLAQEAAKSGSPPSSGSEVDQTTPPGSFCNVEPVGQRDLGGLWKSLLELMATHGPALHSLLSNGQFAGIEDGQAIIRYSKKNETLTKMLERNGKKDLVRDGLSQILGKAVGVRFEVDALPADAATAPSPAPRPAAPSRPAPPPEPQMPAGPPAIRITPELIEQMKQDPLVVSIMDKFNATPVKIE